jgi:hypothetical protein
MDLKAEISLAKAGKMLGRNKKREQFLFPFFILIHFTSTKACLE